MYKEMLAEIEELVKKALLALEESDLGEVKALLQDILDTLEAG